LEIPAPCNASALQSHLITSQPSISNSIGVLLVLYESRLLLPKTPQQRKKIAAFLPLNAP
jgi:hypothetical protein